MSTLTRYALTATAALATGTLAATALTGYRQARTPLPAGLSFNGPDQPAVRAQLLADLTYQQEGTTVSEQSIFTAIEGVIERAQDFLVLDLFLFNSDYDRARGPQGGYPQLTERVTTALLNKRAQAPELPIVFITDPINTFYGSYSLPHLDRLASAGVHVVITDLDTLPDSNPLYSAFYRTVLARLPELPAMLPNALAPGGPKVSPNAYARLFNFKANHRKVVLSEREAVVSSANPHDASAPNSNLGFLVSGPILADILASERAIYTLSGGQGQVFDRFERVLAERLSSTDETSEDGQAVSVQLVTEGAIRRAACHMVRAVEPGGEICLGMFYLAERSIIEELKAAAGRGVRVQAVLDLNIDAFGRTKTGLPALPVARELQRAGVQVRWYATSGEQFHPKYLATYRKGGGETGTFELLAGSGNFTRRNICNYNLETSLRLAAPADAPLAQEFTAYWSRIWDNEPVAGRPALFTLPYEEHTERRALRSALQYLAYRLQEASGVSTF